MAFNPSQSNVVSNNQTRLPNNNSANDPNAFNPQGYNTFDRSSKDGTTFNFADATPIYMSPEIEGNVARVRQPHSLNTLAMQSRLLNNIIMDKTYCSVPWSSIAPNTWELVYKQPTGVTDIVFDDVAQIAKMKDLYIAVYAMLSYLTTSNRTISEVYKITPAIVLACNSWIGNSTILKRLGRSLPFETEVDNLVSSMVEMFASSADSFTHLDYIRFVDSNGVTHTYKPGESLSKLMQFFDDYKFNSMFLATGPTAYGADAYILPVFKADVQETISSVTVAEITATDSTIDPPLKSFLESVQSLTELLPVSFDTQTSEFTSPISEEVNINLQPCIAYQQIIHQFFSNSSIDDVYTAKQWNDSLFAMMHSPLSGAGPFSSIAYSLMESDSLGMFFELDGVSYQYDVFSGFEVSSVLNYVSLISLNTEGNINLFAQFFAYSQALLGLGRSLRDGDYFVSGRPRPFAGQSVDIDINNDGSVTALEVNKSQWIQRFRQAVNRVPRNIYEYMKGIAGVEPTKKLPQPNYIATTSFNIHKMEIENTAENQGNIVTLLRSADDSFAYEVMIDEPSYIIGIVSFMSDNIYPNASHKVSFMSDRLDWFNHFMQHTGDESVQARELYTPTNPYMYEDSPISYQIRYASFKNGLSRVSGAFSYGALKSWYIRRDFEDFEGVQLGTATPPVMSPEFIRNRNIEFDPLFASLTGTNYATRFHFIMAFVNNDYVNSRQAKYPRLDV